MSFPRWSQSNEYRVNVDGQNLVWVEHWSLCTEMVPATGTWAGTGVKKEVTAWACIQQLTIAEAEAEAEQTQFILPALGWDLRRSMQEELHDLRKAISRAKNERLKLDAKEAAD